MEGKYPVLYMRWKLLLWEQKYSVIKEDYLIVKVSDWGPITLLLGHPRQAGSCTCQCWLLTGRSGVRFERLHHRFHSWGSEGKMCNQVDCPFKREPSTLLRETSCKVSLGSLLMGAFYPMGENRRGSKLWAEGEGPDCCAGARAKRVPLIVWGRTAEFCFICLKVCVLLGRTPWGAPEGVNPACRSQQAR